MDYNRSLIKQIEELTLENAVLKRENSRLRADNSEIKAENRLLHARIASLENSIDAKIALAVERMVTPLRIKISELEAEIARKDVEILRLKAITDKDSSNSSKPSSSDGFKKIPNNREKSNNKQGGQEGHKGTSLKIPENLDTLVKEGKAAKRLLDYTGGAKEYVSKWVIDVEVMTVYTEIRYPVEMQLPPEMQPEVVYGNGIKAITILLEQEGVIAIKRLSNFFSSVTGGLVNPSKGTIEAIMSRFANSIDSDIAKIKDDLLNGLVINTDDTQMRCSETQEYGDDGSATLKTAVKTTFGVNIRTYSNDNATLYTVNPKKDDDGIVRDGILSVFHGILAHDHDKKFYKYSNMNATCCEHLLRDLKGLRDLYNCEWADGFRNFLSEMNKQKKADLLYGNNKCNTETLLGYSVRYDLLVVAGEKTLEVMEKKSFGHDELRKMLARLRDYKEAYLLFIKDYTAPFTNNLAERDLRSCKTKQKISGCFRTWKGITDFTKTKSVISTWKKQGLDLFVKIHEKFRIPHSEIITPSGQ